MKHSFAMTVLVSALLAACSEPAVKPLYPEVDSERIRSHIRTLEGLELEGRSAGSPGEVEANQYMFDVFAEMGLSVVRQVVDLTRIEPVTRSIEIMATGSEAASPGFEPGTDLVFWSRHHRETVQVEAELVFVGYGITAPEHDWNDYKDFDITGQIAVILYGFPHVGERSRLGADGQNFYGRRAYKLDEAEHRGAAGALLIHDPDGTGVD